MTKQNIGITVNKANKVLGIIKRTVGTSNRQVFSTLYKSSNIEAVRPGFLRGRKGALINIHTNEGAQGC